MTVFAGGDFPPRLRRGRNAWADAFRQRVSNRSKTLVAGEVDEAALDVSVNQFDPDAVAHVEPAGASARLVVDVSMDWFSAASRHQNPIEPPVPDAWIIHNRGNLRHPRRGCV